jgi:hemolysin III
VKGSHYFRPLPRHAASHPEAPEPIGGQPRLVKPRLRGVSHRWAFFASLFTGVALILVLVAPTKRAVAAAIVYALSLSALFGVSALYHEVTWSVPVRRWMRRLDHSMIFVLIAGTYTPVAILVLPRPFGLVLLAAVWLATVAGVAFNLAWITAPRWIAAALYLALGWIAIVALPDLVTVMSLPTVLFLLVGGVAYSVGALVYATRRPNPAPAIFGYHEVFHVLTIVAAVMHFSAVARIVLLLS